VIGPRDSSFPGPADGPSGGRLPRGPSEPGVQRTSGGGTSPYLKQWQAPDDTPDSLVGGDVSGVWCMALFCVDQITWLNSYNDCAIVTAPLS